MNLYQVTKFSPSLSFTVYYFHLKISSFTPVLSIRIVLDSFYPLIFCCEKFSTSISRLPFAINVTFNLSNSDFVPWHVLLSPLPFTIKPVFSQSQAKDPFFLRHFRLEGQDFPILSHSSISETERVEKWIINLEVFVQLPQATQAHLDDGGIYAIWEKEQSKKIF